jgi:hypothetical protein
MPARTTSAAWGQGAKNSLIVVLGTLWALCIATAAVLIIFKQPFFLALILSLGALSVLSLLAFLANGLYGRGVRGRVLLDCGRFPMWRRGLFAAAACGFCGLMSAFLALIGSTVISKYVNRETVVFQFGLSICFLSLALFWLLRIGSRLQVCEKGIWEYSFLLPWSKIRSFRWANDTTLVIGTNGFSLSGEELRVPLEHKQAVEELFAKHCPKAVDL